MVKSINVVDAKYYLVTMRKNKQTKKKNHN